MKRFIQEKLICMLFLHVTIYLPKKTTKFYHIHKNVSIAMWLS